MLNLDAEAVPSLDIRAAEYNEVLACRGPLSPNFLSFSFESLVYVFSKAIELFADLSSLF